jgi:hypothetical protein
MIAGPVLSAILLERAMSLPCALRRPSLLLLPGDRLLLRPLRLRLLPGLPGSLSGLCALLLLWLLRSLLLWLLSRLRALLRLFLLWLRLLGPLLLWLLSRLRVLLRLLLLWLGLLRPLLLRLFGGLRALLLRLLLLLLGLLGPLLLRLLGGLRALLLGRRRLPLFSRLALLFLLRVRIDNRPEKQ